MFSKADKSRVQSTRPPEKPAAPSIISENLTVTGNLASDGDIQIDGTIDGDVRSKRLTIGQTAVINGAVMGDHVRIAGTVNGEITAKKVELTENAKVTGDMPHSRATSITRAVVAWLASFTKRAVMARVRSLWSR